MPLSLLATDTRKTAPLTVSVLHALQAEQFEHDEKFHREIARLPTQDRLRHMTLHFSKYVGYLLQATDNEEQTIVDTFVIALSSANILGVHLSPSETRQTITRKELVKRIGIATGRMSAACEKLDHLEDFPFRMTLRDGVIGIAEAVMNYSLSQKLDLPHLVRNRLSNVRNKAFIPGRP